jgi:hypothetical protein
MASTAANGNAALKALFVTGSEIPSRFFPIFERSAARTYHD